MHALVRFAQSPAANTFSIGEIHRHVIAALGCAIQQYSLASLRYDLSKLGAKGLVEKLHPAPAATDRSPRDIPSSIYLKLFDRVYAPLTARPPATRLR